MFFKSFLSKVQAHPGSLLNAVATLIGATAAEEREKALEALRGIIVAQHADFDNNDMHDAQEFLTVLLQNLAVSFFQFLLFLKRSKIRKNPPS